MAPKELHSGGQPVEERRVRQGDLSWVPAVSEKGNFRVWYIKFKNFAKSYLSTEVYPNAEARRDGYYNALMKAADLGANDQFVLDLDLYDSAGIQCEALLEKMKLKYMPRDAHEALRLSKEFYAFNRDGKLGESIAQLNLLLLECRKAGFTPDDECILMKYRHLLRREEIPIFEMYLARDSLSGKRPLGESDAEQTKRVIELLALDKEGIPKKQESGGFAGGAFSKESGKGKGKQNKEPRRAGFSGGNAEQTGANKTECSKCGRPNCKSLKTKNMSDCNAHNKECSKCKETGHYAKCCKKKAQNAQQGQKQKAKKQAHFAEAEDYEESGAEDVPPGFQKCQPRA
jgi:hypothetical protein